MPSSSRYTQILTLRRLSNWATHLQSRCKFRAGCQDILLRVCGVRELARIALGMSPSSNLAAPVPLSCSHRHCASGSGMNVQGFAATCPSRSARRCAVMRQGAGSSRTLHTVPLSSCTDVQLRARHCRCRLVAAWRKAPMWLRRPSALRERLPCQSVL